MRSHQAAHRLCSEMNPSCLPDCFSAHSQIIQLHLPFIMCEEGKYCNNCRNKSQKDTHTNLDMWSQGDTFSWVQVTTTFCPVSMKYKSGATFNSFWMITLPKAFSGTMKNQSCCPKTNIHFFTEWPFVQRFCTMTVNTDFFFSFSVRRQK